LKHEIHRMRPVFDGSRYCGALLHTIHGWDAHDASGRKVGDYPAELVDEAVARCAGTPARVQAEMPIGALAWPLVRLKVGG
jgi:hypothetical protein